MNNLRNYYTIELSQVQLLPKNKEGVRNEQLFNLITDFSVSNECVEKANGMDYILGDGLRSMNEYVNIRKQANEHKAGLNKFRANRPCRVVIRTLEGQKVFDSINTEKFAGCKLFYSENKRLQIQLGSRTYLGLLREEQLKRVHSMPSVALPELNKEMQIEYVAERKYKALQSAAMLQLEAKIKEKQEASEPVNSTNE